MNYWNIANDNWPSNIISTIGINNSCIKCMIWFRHNYHQCTPMTSASKIAHKTNRNLSIPNISTTTSTTMNIDCITPTTSTFDALQSNSITNIPMILNFVIPSKSCCINQSQQTILWQLSSTITIDLTEIDFAKLQIQLSPAIARLDNLVDHNLGNNLTATIEFIII